MTKDSQSAQDSAAESTNRLMLHGLPFFWCVSIAGLGIFPGSLSALPCVFHLLIPLGFIASAIAWLKAVFRGDGLTPSAAAWALAVALFLCASMLELFSGVAFSLVREEFELAAAEAPPPGAWVPGGPTIGIYKVKQILSDHQGGIYFILHESGWLGNARYDGFAWHAKEDGYPLGDVKAFLSPIGNNWSVFSVSWSL